MYVIIISWGKSTDRRLGQAAARNVLNATHRIDSQVGFSKIKQFPGTVYFYPPHNRQIPFDPSAGVKDVYREATGRVENWPPKINRYNLNKSTVKSIITFDSSPSNKLSNCRVLFLLLLLENLKIIHKF